MRTKVALLTLILLVTMTACGVDPTISSPTAPPPQPTIPVPGTAPPAATATSYPVPTATAVSPAWLRRTQALDTYRLHLRIHVAVERSDGRVDEGLIVDAVGAFHDRDVEYQQIGSAADTGGRLGAGGSLYLIMTNGRTYIRGPASLLGLDSPTWYQIDPSLLSTAGPVYNVSTTLSRLFGVLDLSHLGSAGVESLDGQRCDRNQGDENTAPHMVAHLVGALSDLKLDQPVRQQLQDQGSTLTSSEATIVICPDGYLHRIEARYGYRPPQASDGEVTWTLTLDLTDINSPITVAAPSDAIVFRAAAAFLPPAATLTTAAAAEVASLVEQGRAQLEAGDARAAAITLSQALARDPRAVDAYFARGEAYSLLEQYAHAIDDYTHAIALVPDFADAFRRRAFARRQSNDIRGAIADYTEAIRLNGDDNVAYLGRGLAYGEAMGKWQDAADDYTRALAINPNYTSAYHNRGAARRHLGDYEGAIADYTEEIKREPDDPSAYRGRGLSYLQLQNYQRAIDDLDIAIRLDPASAAALCNRGAAYLGLHDYAAAARDSNESIRLDPDDPCAYVNRGKARVMLGDSAGALDDYQHALDLVRQCACQNDLKEQIREQIRKLQPESGI